MKITIGLIVVIGGLGMITLGLFGVWQGQLVWLSFAIAGFGLAIAGWSLVSNKKFSDFFEMLRDSLGL